MDTKCRMFFPDITQNLSFFCTRGYKWQTVHLHRYAETDDKKFSAHLVVKHPTRMFPNLQSMATFLKGLESHPGYEHVCDIIDTSVYKPGQLFRTPCSTKAPHYNCETCSFDLCTVNNMLLPVDSNGHERQVLYPYQWQGGIYMSPVMWARYLVTTPVAEHIQCEALEGTGYF